MFEVKRRKSSGGEERQRLYQNVRDREKDGTNQRKGTRVDGRGWENKKKGVERIDGKGVDWVLLKLILIQQAASLPTPQLEAAVASTIIMIFTNCPINTIIKMDGSTFMPSICILLKDNVYCHLKGTDVMVE